ncbi:Hypothetical protein CINCED_3A000049, partial [Cinara cedri]
HKQLKLSEVGKVQPTKKLNQDQFDRENIKLIIETVSPFSFIEYPAFINYCSVTSNKVPYSTTEINSQEYNLQSTSSALSRECPSTNSDSEDDFFSFGENSSDTNVDIKLLVNNYLSNGNLKSPL